MDERELRKALDALPPSSLDYSDWAKVGMALKESGYPVQLWDEWSSRDTARYHKGECEKKWHTFQGTASPITVASIFDMAYKNGYQNEGFALDWGDEIAADRDVIISPSWVEAKEIVIPETWNPAEQLSAYLQALFEPTENVGYCTESWEKEGRWMPNRGAYDRTAGQLIEALAKCGGDIGRVVGDYHEEAGAWIRFNPLDGNGCKNDNVTEFRFALVESDDLDIAKQNALLRELELPIAALVHSGKKSLHAIVRVDAADYTQYRKRVDYLYTICQKNGLTLDIQNKNPSRLSRMPGIMRGGQKQYLVDTNIGKANFEEWKEFIEASTDDLPDVESIADVWDNLPELSPPLIENVLRQGHKMLLAGPSKAGKSFALIELCIAIAEGKQWMGRFNCTKGKVLYINLELDRASCLHRFKDVYTALKLAPQNLKNVDIWNLRGASVPMDKLAPKLIRRASKKGYIAVVIDPIYKVITGDENSADQMAKFCNQFDLVCKEVGSAVIYCHHHSKGTQGAKRSMDRASGSGVFARDPDAMLDLIEIEPSDGVMEHQENQAICHTCMSFLEQAGKADEVGQDEALSPVQTQDACKRLLSSDMQVQLAAALDAAQRAATNKTAWRIEGTLREFSRFAPLNCWFDYPIHAADEVGILADAQAEDAPKPWQKNLGKRWEKPKQDRQSDQKKSLDTAFSAITGLGDQATIYNLAEYMGTTERTIRRRIKDHGEYWIDGANVGRK